MVRLTNILSFASAAILACASPLETRAFSEEDIAKWLDGHNTIRALHGAVPLKWDDSLARFAQSWADQCIGHGATTGTGENVFIGAGATIEEAIQSWSSEAYDPANPGNGNHFTQVVWKNSWQLGCGVAECPAGTFFACDYFVTGNVEGQFDENVQP